MGKRNKINKQCKVRYIFEKWNNNKYIKNINIKNFYGIFQNL